MLLFKQIIYISLFLFVCACSSTDNNNEKVNIIHAPQWVNKSVSSENIFYGIGLTDKNGSIRDVIKYAEGNAIENLKPTISVKVNEFFDEEIVSFNQDKKDEYRRRLQNATNSLIKTIPLTQISRREAMWVSPDNDTTYIMMVIDKPFIIKYLTFELEKMEQQYKYDEEFLVLLKEIKEDVSAGLIARKRTQYQQVLQDNKYANMNFVNKEPIEPANIIDDDNINNLIDLQENNKK